MGKKLIALDVDGVLNTDSSREHSMFSMSRRQCECLVDTIRITDAWVVISSDWRFESIVTGWNVSKRINVGPDSQFQLCLKKVLSEESFQFLISRIVGHTLDLECSREDQILEFVSESGLDIDVFCAIDDDEEHFPSNPNWLVLTDPTIGFTEDTKQKVITKLMGI